MVEIGDEVYSYIYPEECNIGIIVDRKSEMEFIVDWINRETGKLYKRTIFDYNIYGEISREEPK